jgi:hypothetical protein
LLTRGAVPSVIGARGRRRARVCGVDTRGGVFVRKCRERHQAGSALCRCLPIHSAAAFRPDFDSGVRRRARQNVDPEPCSSVCPPGNDHRPRHLVGKTDGGAPRSDRPTATRVFNNRSRFVLGVQRRGAFLAQVLQRIRHLARRISCRQSRPPFGPARLSGQRSAIVGVGARDPHNHAGGKSLHFPRLAADCALPASRSGEELRTRV